MSEIEVRHVCGRMKPLAKEVERVADRAEKTQLAGASKLESKDFHELAEIICQIH